jgi:2-hydroxychromene-2-carboxylate isomerase
LFRQRIVLHDRLPDGMKRRRLLVQASPIDFYFDFASPYGYLASLRIDDLAARYGRTVRWRPMMLGAAMKVTGAQPLMNIPLRADYARRDLVRFARILGVPFTFPPTMPIVSLAAARAFYWLEEDDPVLAHRFAKAAYEAHFGRGEDIGDASRVAAVAATLGIDPDALVDAVARPEIKARLKAETDAAIARGVFGSPFLFVDDEPFWGVDRLDHLEIRLKEDAGR